MVEGLLSTGPIPSSLSLCSKVISGTQKTSKYNLQLIAQGKQPHSFNANTFTAVSHLKQKKNIFLLNKHFLKLFSQKIELEKKTSMKRHKHWRYSKRLVVVYTNWI